jgi:hypothetical protein
VWQSSSVGQHHVKSTEDDRRGQPQRADRRDARQGDHRAPVSAGVFLSPVVPVATRGSDTGGAGHSVGRQGRSWAMVGVHVDRENIRRCSRLRVVVPVRLSPPGAGPGRRPGVQAQ